MQGAVCAKRRTLGVRALLECHFAACDRELSGLRFQRACECVEKRQASRVGACDPVEVDHHELWQRTRLTLSCVAREYREAEKLLDEAERYLAGQDFELVRADRDVVTLD